MALETNAFSSFGAIGNREDLSNVIHNIAPTETPFMNAARKTKASAVLHEWQTDTLGAASGSNFVLEGDAITNDARTATVRVSNTCAISDKTARITGTQEVVSKAGRKSEMAYAMAQRAKELKRDVETILLQNNAEVTGGTTTARECAGIEAWIATNTSEAADATNATGNGNDARTSGTARAFTEAQLKSVIQQCWTSGGNPSTIMVGAFNKQQLSGFSGGSTAFVDANDKKLVASVDIYESDFGALKVVPNRFQNATTALVLDMDYWAMASLRPFQTKPIARTGDSEARQILVEYTLEACNEAASGAVYDLTTS
jgi:hypothetical protein